MDSVKTLTVRYLIPLLLLAGLPVVSAAQQWWAPGACWTFEEIWPQHIFHKYAYTGDTVIGGMEVQVATYTPCYVYPDSVHCGTAWPVYEYISLQGDVLLAGVDAWDTLYYLGDPGDRWWPIASDESCPPFGMVEIQDTGHVVIGGLNLRTWDLAILDENGQPMQTWFEADTFDLIERIGGNPRRPFPLPCDPDVTMDYPVNFLRHYSDNDISIPEAMNCDIVTHAPQPIEKPTPALHHDPGYGQLRVTGLSPGTNTIEVYDAVGRQIARPISFGGEAFIDAANWASGAYQIVVSSADRTRQVLRWVKE